MARKTKLPRRQKGTRRWRKLFLIAVEGRRTERQYFGQLNTLIGPNVHIDCKPGRKSAPEYVLSRIKEMIKDIDTRHPYEAWVVVDTDQWAEDQLRELHTWSCQCDEYDLAVSNPFFEMWLLMHYESGIGVSSSSDCLNRLKRHNPNYGKSECPEFSLEVIRQASGNAKSKDVPRCKNWPRVSGTTVYRLVDNILESQ